MFNEAEAIQDPKAEEPTVEEVTVAAHKRKKKRTYEELTEGLPEEEILLEMQGEQLVCEKCGGTFRLIGKKYVKSEIIYIPASVKLLKYYACTYACDRCEKETGYAHVAGTAAPPSLMKHSLASPSADETEVQVLKEEGKASGSPSRMWVYVSPERSGKAIRYYEYQPDRKGIRAVEFLRGYRGYLVTDGYSGYDQVEGVTRCGCWAHMRRKWREAMPKGATMETSKAAVGYSGYIQIETEPRSTRHKESTTNAVSPQSATARKPFPEVFSASPCP